MSEYLPYVFVGAILALFLYRIVRFGGFKASLFGAKIEETVGEIGATGAKLTRTRLRVHALNDPTSAERRVGLELAASTFGAFQVHPISLSRSEAIELSQLLTKAAG